MLLASRLTSKVDIEEPTTENTSGEVSETWAAIATNVPAEMINREAMTAKQAGGIQAQTSHLVTIRYRSDLTVTSTCRLKLGTRVLNILGPPRRKPEARPVELIMECMEVES